MDAATVAGPRAALPVLATHVGIIIVCEVRLVRDGLVELLEAETGLSVVAHASGGDEALGHLYRAPPPDIVLIDAALLQGVAMVRRFRGIDPQIRCVPFGIDDALETASLWAEAGAAGIVRRSASLAELVGVLEGVMRNDCAGEGNPRPDAFPRAVPALAGRVPAPPRRRLPAASGRSWSRSTPGAATRRSPAVSGSSRRRSSATCTTCWRS